MLSLWPTPQVAYWEDLNVPTTSASALEVKCIAHNPVLQELNHNPLQLLNNSAIWEELRMEKQDKALWTQNIGSQR